MARFHGVVGYGINQETYENSGVWQDVIVERTLGGSVLRRSLDRIEDDKVNPDVRVNVAISVMADAFALANYAAIRYVKYEGALWSVTTRTPERPRITLELGGLYHGVTPVPSD